MELVTYGFCNDAVSKHRMVKLLVNNELERMWKQVVAAYFKVLYRALSGGTDENHVKPVSRSRFDSRIRRSAYHSAATFGLIMLFFLVMIIITHVITITVNSSLQVCARRFCIVISFRICYVLHESAFSLFLRPCLLCISFFFFLCSLTPRQDDLCTWKCVVK
jgi:hypothetical protein